MAEGGTLMGLREDLRIWVDAHGFVQDRTDGTRGITSGNGWVYTAAAAFALFRRGELQIHDALYMRDLFGKCWKRDEDGRPIVGLLTRAPGHPKQESQEDYIAAFALCRLFGLYDIAEAMFDYGQKRHLLVCKYVYNNEAPGKFSGSAWMGRFAPFVAHVYYCRGLNPPALYAWRWRKELEAAGDDDRTPESKPKEDERILAWLKVCCAPRTKENAEAIEHWKRELRADYPGGIPQVFAEHFTGHDGQRRYHPLEHSGVTGWE